MTNEKKQEFTLRITQANKSQLIVLLYEIFLQYMEDAKDALADGQKDAFHRSMEKSIDCLRELTDSVQEPDPGYGNCKGSDQHRQKCVQGRQEIKNSEPEKGEGSEEGRQGCI